MGPNRSCEVMFCTNHYFYRGVADNSEDMSPVTLFEFVRCALCTSKAVLIFNHATCEILSGDNTEASAEYVETLAIIPCHLSQVTATVSCFVMGWACHYCARNG